jgi:hypothetical protein
MSEKFKIRKKCKHKHDADFVEDRVESKKIRYNTYTRCEIHDHNNEICDIYECSGHKYTEPNNMPYIH